MQLRVKDLLAILIHELIAEHLIGIDGDSALPFNLNELVKPFRIRLVCPLSLFFFCLVFLYFQLGAQLGGLLDDLAHRLEFFVLVDWMAVDDLNISLRLFLLAW